MTFDTPYGGCSGHQVSKSSWFKITFLKCKFPNQGAQFLASNQFGVYKWQRYLTSWLVKIVKQSMARLVELLKLCVGFFYLTLRSVHLLTIPSTVGVVVESLTIENLGTHIRLKTWHNLWTGLLILQVRFICIQTMPDVFPTREWKQMECQSNGRRLSLWRRSYF